MSIFRCKFCNERVKVANSICPKCKLYLKEKEKTIYKPDPTLGKQDFDYKGKPICKLCGKAFDNLGNHIYSAHGITVKEYRIKFDLPSGLSLSSKERFKKLSARPVPKVLYDPNFIRKGGIKGQKKRITSQQRQQRAEQMRKVSMERWHGST